MEKIWDRDALYKEALQLQPLKERVIYSNNKGNGWPVIHVLVPNFLSDNEVRTEMERISHNYGKKEYFEELLKLFEEVNREAAIHLCRMSDYKEVVDEIPKGTTILNLCDGSDVDGVPGPGVVKYLEEKGIPYIGCDHYFMDITVRKFEMKEKFIEHGVSTAKWVVVTKDNPLRRDRVTHMTYPFFVKAGDSYGSIGLSDKSVCNNFEECEAQVQVMLNMFSNVLVEEFIHGAEYSVLIIGDTRCIEVYPPAQRIFDPSIPSKDQFLSYKLVWEEGGEKYKYALTDRDADLIADLAKRAYLAVGGNGFGRVDIRRRDATNEYFVLEVNATCGVGYDSSSSAILALGGKGTSHLLKRVLEIGNHPVTDRKKPTA